LRCADFIVAATPVVLRRGVTIPTDRSVAQLVGELPGGGEVWDVIAYNAYYFNAHKMAPILAQVLEEPRDDVRKDPRLVRYLERAGASVQLYENIKDLTARDIAAAIVSAREVGLSQAEDLSDVLVGTVSAQLPRLSAQRVSFFVTAFAKQSIADSQFWRAAASAVAVTSEVFSAQVLVSLLDAFRKSGLRSERLFLALSRHLYNVLEDLMPAHIPPIVATLCRVPLPHEERERAVRALLSRWLAMLRAEQAHTSGAVTIPQVLSLTVSLGLAPEEINTAVFARDVSAFIGDRFDRINTEDLIVFLWALQRLVPSGSMTTFFARGLRSVRHAWPELQSNAQLSIQRLTQLSDVLVATRHEGAWDTHLAALQDLLLRDLAESIQYCLGDGVAELLEIWSGNEAFWRHYRDFAEAVVKRIEELLLESGDLDELVPVLQAALSTPGLLASLPKRAQRALMTAIASRGAKDAERIRAILAGSPWEVLCAQPIGFVGGPTADVTAAVDSVEVGNPESPQGDTGTAAKHVDFADLLESWRRPRTDVELVSFLRSAVAHARGADDALHALESAAPFAQRLAADATAEVLELLAHLGDVIVAAIDLIPSVRIVAALRACAIAGLPHVSLFVAATTRLNSRLGPLLLVDALEACAALRLSIPELGPWLERLMGEGVDRRLPFAGLTRLVAAAARLSLLDVHIAQALMERLLTVASPLRPPAPDAIATLCQGLYLSGWVPRGAELWQLAAWLVHAESTPRAPIQDAALRRFSLAVLADPECRSDVGAFQPEMRRALAAAIRKPVIRRHHASDTSLKFRHEVAEELRRAGRAYDLDLCLGAGVRAELWTRVPEDAIWLLDGPEAFHRPFSPSGLRLVPAQLRRAELLVRLGNNGGEMAAALRKWEDQDGPSLPLFGLAALPTKSTTTLGMVARLHWLEWADMAGTARLGALADPQKRLVT